MIKTDYVLLQDIVDGVPTRVRRVHAEDCIVEVMEEEGVWKPSDDAHASRTYMIAMLNAYGTIEPIDHATFDVPLLNRGRVKVILREDPCDGLGLVLSEAGHESWRAFADQELVAIREALHKRVRHQADRARFRIREAEELLGSGMGVGEASRLRKFISDVTEGLARLVP